MPTLQERVERLEQRLRKGDFIVPIHADHHKLGGIDRIPSGGISGAPDNAQYLVLAAAAGLSSERIWTPGSGLQATDGGAGAAYTVKLGDLTELWDDAGGFNQQHRSSAAFGVPAGAADVFTLDIDGTLSTARIIGMSTTQAAGLLFTHHLTTFPTTVGANISLGRSRGSRNSPTIISNGDLIWSIKGYGHDGVHYQQAAAVIAYADGVVAADDMPTRLAFYTTPDGTKAWVERVRIDNAGNLWLLDQKEFRFYDSGSSNYVGFKADAARTTDLVYILPATDPTAGQVLSASAPSAGVVTLSWADDATGAGAVATDAIWDAKGDLAVGTGANTAVAVTVGANDTILMADSAQAAGVKWVASGTPSTQAFGDAAAEGTTDGYTRTDHKHAMPANPVTAHESTYAHGDIAGHIADAADAHDASAISILDTAAQYTATDVEAALAEVLDAVQAHEADTSAVHEATSLATTNMKQQFLLQGWRPTTTSGCATGAVTEVGSTTKHDIYGLAFDSATAESAFVHHPMPDNWDGGTVTFRVWWLAHTGYVVTSSDGVAWTLKATSYGDDESVDAVFGTGITVTDTGTGNNKLEKTADSSALTISGAAAGEMIHWVITRTVSDAADDWAADVELISVVIEYGISALSS